MLKNGINGNDAADQAASHALESLPIADTHYNCTYTWFESHSSLLLPKTLKDPQRSAPVRPQDHLSTVDLHAVATAEAG